MKRAASWFLVLAAWCCAAQAAGDPAIKELVRKKAEELMAATIKGDCAAVADMTHPRVAEKSGGREKLIALLEKGMKDLRGAGMTLQATRVSEPWDPVAGGTDLFVVVPYVLEMKVPGGKLLGKACLIGISGDSGKTWTFINGIDNMDQLKDLLPNFPDQLKLPAKEKPVLVKDKAPVE